jgi:hypothetical protein
MVATLRKESRLPVWRGARIDHASARSAADVLKTRRLKRLLPLACCPPAIGRRRGFGFLTRERSDPWDQTGRLQILTGRSAVSGATTVKCLLYVTSLEAQDPNLTKPQKVRKASRFLPPRRGRGRPCLRAFRCSADCVILLRCEIPSRGQKQPAIGLGFQINANWCLESCYISGRPRRLDELPLLMIVWGILCCLPEAMVRVTIVTLLTAVAPTR